MLIWYNLGLLDLQDTMVSGTVPKEFGQLLNLKSILLAGTRMTGEIDKDICDLESLEYICVERDSEESAPLNSTDPPIECDCKRDICKC